MHIKLRTFLFLISLCLILVTAVPGLALAFPMAVSAAGSNPSIQDYFKVSYTTQFGDTNISYNENFSLTITGTITCIKDLVFPYNAVGEANITGAITAVAATSGSEITLYPSYNLKLSPFPKKAGQSIQASKKFNLKFPGKSPSDSYNIMGKLIRAQAKSGLLTVDITNLLPQSTTLGTIQYSGR
jgi:hypothetical protein